MKINAFFRRLISNDISLMVISLVLAFTIWFVINANSQTESDVTISNIPITIDLPQEAKDEGMQVFAGDDITASVEVSGNRITVGSLTSADIQVVALQSGSIIAPGSYNLELSAKKVGVKTNYNFASNVSPSTITVYVDKLKEKTFDITDDIVYKIDEDYYANSSLSETSVTLSGPETEISAIDKVVVQGTLEGNIGSTTKGEYDLVYLDKDGKILDVKMSKATLSTVTVTLTPLPIVEVNLELDVVNAPKGYPVFTVSPRKIKIAADQKVIDDIKDNTVSIGTLDFAALKNKKNVIEYDIVLPNGCKNLSEYTTAKVTIDLSDYSTKTLKVNSFRSENIDLTKYSVAYNSTGLEVVVCGPADILDEINAVNVIAKVDFSGKLEDTDKHSLSLELPIYFEFTNGYSECWVYGDYTASANVTEK